MRIFSTALSVLIVLTLFYSICRKESMSRDEIMGNFIFILSSSLNIYFMWN